ncbi:MAG: 50S ribosomal protein L24 [Oscillospiraceae bacterium]
MNKIHVKTGDSVQMMSGKDKGKKGKVVAVSPKEGKIIVEGINIVKKHTKPKMAGQTGGIVEGESAFYACKAMLVCPKCKKPTRLGHTIAKDGTKKRICKHKECGETF